jgi:hypothetical protein
MKTLKYFFMVALLSSFAIGVNAQSEITNPTATYWIYVECDGVPDYITGKVELHRIRHYNPNTSVLEWVKLMFKSNSMVSVSTGEVFSVNLTRKIDYGEMENVIVTRFNLRGNMGSHILVTRYWYVDPSTGEILTEIDETKCL